MKKECAMKWFIYSISSLATAAVITISVVMGSTIYSLFNLSATSGSGEAFFGAMRLESGALPDGGSEHANEYGESGARGAYAYHPDSFYFCRGGGI